MTIGLTSDHEALRDSVRGWTGRHLSREVLRRAVEDSTERQPSWWETLAGQGLLSIHLPAKYGGGYGLTELTIVLEEFGRALLPGPYLPTVLASSLLVRLGDPALGESLLPALADGRRIGAVGLEPGLRAEHLPCGGLRVTGATGGVVGGLRADVLVLSAQTSEGEAWFVADAHDVDVTAVPGLDLTRRLAAVTAHDAVTIPAPQLLGVGAGPLVRELAAVLAAAEAGGIAAWCLDTAVEHAKIREQFGRPIGAFQAVKHRCAEMLLALEQARASAWDAARAIDSGPAGSLATAVAAVLAPDAAVRCAKDCIQVLGGIGYTWEHDAHLYLRRALTLRAVIGGSAEWTQRVAALTLDGVRREVEIDLESDAGVSVDVQPSPDATALRPPSRAAALRAQTKAAATELAGLEETDRRAALAAAGWLVPHLPKPWGRDADALEQLVIQQEFRAAGVDIPDLSIAAWVVPTLVVGGTQEQQERFLPPTLRGEIVWCQLFSEPGAGSDLAALSTRGDRVPGGWRVTGQKIWTSVAHVADWGICLIRTDRTVAKHKGLTYVLVDMRSPGIEVRPLREMTGRALFNEVFLDEVFVPDDCVVGSPGDGWRLARTTLANERVALATGWAQGAGVEDLLDLVAERGARPDAAVCQELGALTCEEQSFALLGLRATLRRLSGVEPGPISSVRKLLGIRHAQRVAEYGWSLVGLQGAAAAGPAARWGELVLSTRAMSIAGGTTEVQLNIIAERLLGLPRDP